MKRSQLIQRFVVGSVLVALSLVGAACGGDDGNNEDSVNSVKIAVSAPLAVDPGQDMQRGVELALQQAGGKAGGVEVELLALNSSGEDSPYSAEAEQAAARAAVDDASVVAYIGPYTSGQTSASLPILNEAGIVQMSLATWPGITKPGYGPGEPGIYYPTGKRTYFRVVPADDIQAVVGAQMLDELGLARVFIVDDGSKYGAGVAGIFEVTAVDFGMDVLGHAQFDPATATAETYADLAGQALTGEPDVVYFGGYADDGGGDLAVALRTLAPDVAIMGADALLTDSLMRDYDAALVEGIYATHMVVPADKLETEAAADLIAAYSAEYGEDTVPLLAVSTYEAALVMLKAIEQADSPTREGVYDALRAMESFDGVLGTWTFDSNGDITPAPITVWQVQQGEWAFVELVQ